MQAIDWHSQFQAQPQSMTAAPMSAASEDDTPPGAPPYVDGPLAIPRPSSPSPTPPQQSLTTLAAGGMNHQELWMNGLTSPITPPTEQGPFPGNAPSNAPAFTSNFDADAVKHLSFGSAFQSQGY